ncbi:hypothetical protein LSH36_88g00021 [Paralvinella palmiformis]|uniref:Caspase-3 n=1 Tax=Paralvinella palmiformis TaxID=53620 RepID=A0AAD9ND95_9ANNE|nr:hypothetical protein LSH36_88g00021 [Paralvinella palmiformis]
MAEGAGDKMPLEERTPAEGQDKLDSRLNSLALSSSVDDKYRYHMNHKNRGHFIIINNKNFDSSTNMGNRNGTDEDAANLYQRFKELGFDVKSYNNLKKIQMLKVMTDASRWDHSECDCFGCAMLSHGDEGVVYGTDGQIALDRLIQPFKGPQSYTLRGKPKIFIIQACRGDQLDHGVEVQSDSEVPIEEKVYRIPVEADFVYAYSTVAGYYSWRNSTKGSWFIQAMCKMLKQHAYNMNFVQILTRVNYEVAYEFESNASKESMNKKKQVPSIVSMLTKDLIFNRK